MSLDFRFASTSLTPVVGGPLAFTFKAAQNASGFSVTSLGTPSSRLAQVAQPALSGALFGTPAGPHNVSASGFQAAKVGIPSIPLKAEGWSITTFPEPFAAYRQIGIAQGWTASSFGEGGLGSTQTTYGQGQLVQAFGFAAAAFGDAVASWDVSASVEGFKVSAVGSPSSGYRATAQGIGPAQFGAPVSVIQCRSAGFADTKLGQPLAGTVHVVVGQPAGVRFGVPVKRLRCAHDATGLRLPARFGKPKATQPTAHRSRGLDVGRRFGRPSTRCHA